MDRCGTNTTHPNVALALGFTEDANGEQTRNGYTLRSDRRWLPIEQRTPFSGDPLRDLLGKPGLWRSRRTERGTCLVFELPALPTAQEVEHAGSAHPAAALLEWAERCMSDDGTLRANPLPDDIDDWLAPSQRGVRAGSHLAQIELIASEERLALSVPRLVGFASELSPARQTWLREACHDAQQSWRLVRFGIADGAERQQYVCAEVDLTGAPAAQLRPLFELALVALTSSAAWALPGLALIADASNESRLLNRRPPRAERCSQ